MVRYPVSRGCTQAAMENAGNIQKLSSLLIYDDSGYSLIQFRSYTTLFSLSNFVKQREPYLIISIQMIK
jgi:hypothetical protein